MSPSRRTVRRHLPRFAGIVAASALLVAALLALPSGVARHQIVGRSVPVADTVPAGSPFGSLDSSREWGSGLRLVGWAIDPDRRRQAVTVRITIDGYTRQTVTADQNRTDIPGARTFAGPDHGFVAVQSVPEGQHRVCAWADTIGAGSDQRLGCHTADFHWGPVGEIDFVDASHGAIAVRGWGFDRDQIRSALHATITVDGRSTSVPAGRRRYDVANTFPLAGPDHGFFLSTPAGQGTHQVCVTLTNLGVGSDTALGCRNVTLDDDPIGELSVAAQSGGGIFLRGFAYDLDSPTSPVSVAVSVDGARPVLVRAGDPRSWLADAVSGIGAAHGFHFAADTSEGQHTVCVTIRNVQYGSDTALACRSVSVDFTPGVGLGPLQAQSTGVAFNGWAIDPDDGGAVTVDITLDGHAVPPVVADLRGPNGGNRAYHATLTTVSGTHQVCVVAVNLGHGSANSPQECNTITLALGPVVHFGFASRPAGGTALRVVGWAFDPDTTSPLSIGVTLDGQAAPTLIAGERRTDVAAAYPAAGASHGLDALVPADDGEHTVCLTAHNVGGGTDTSLGCREVDAVDPVAPSPVTGLVATPDYGQVTLSWAAPASDGGAPPSAYSVIARPGGQSVTVSGTTLTATITGLHPATAYSFFVRASNVAGASHFAAVAARTPSGPPPQSTPAPVSTSRYVRNVFDSSPAARSTMYREGRADALHNPSGHRYLQLLDIGGQDRADQGVVLSASTGFITYGDLSRDLMAYVDGYASGQRGTAPATIAIGTNNDIDVTTTSGIDWATKVVRPVVIHSLRYGGISVAGADDIEPGFRGSYRETTQWLAGYLSGTRAPFVFNGSADGCAYSYADGGCNNGWSARGLQYLAGGAAALRMSVLPQVYNTTMAAQWKYISLTGRDLGLRRLTFGGVLTEFTACAQAGSCGSLHGVTAWQALWNDLRSDGRVSQTDLPYSTDLRIDR